MGRGRFRRAARKTALAETLGNDVGPQAPKSVAGPSGKQTNTRNLFQSKMKTEGGKAAADAGGARVAGTSQRRAIAHSRCA
jgi:hypothetical protein